MGNLPQYATFRTVFNWVAGRKFPETNDDDEEGLVKQVDRARRAVSRTERNKDEAQEARLVAEEALKKATEELHKAEAEHTEAVATRDALDLKKAEGVKRRTGQTSQPGDSAPAFIQVSKPSVVHEAKINEWKGLLEAAATKRKSAVQELSTVEIGIKNLKENMPTVAEDESGTGEPRERSRDRKAEEAKAKLLKSEAKKAALTKTIAQCDETKEKVTARLEKFRAAAEVMNSLCADAAADEERLVDSDSDGED